MNPRDDCRTVSVRTRIEYFAVTSRMNSSSFLTVRLNCLHGLRKKTAQVLTKCSDKTFLSEMPRKCVVIGCNRSQTNGKFTFHSFPNVSRDIHTNNLLNKRRMRWMEAIGLKSVGKNKFVCGRHFHSGKPANLLDIHNVDWVPTVDLDLPADKSGLIEDSESSDGESIPAPTREAAVDKFPAYRAEPSYRNRNINSVSVSGENDLDLPLNPTTSVGTSVSSSTSPAKRGREKHSTSAASSAERIDDTDLPDPDLPIYRSESPRSCVSTSTSSGEQIVRNRIRTSDLSSRDHDDHLDLLLEHSDLDGVNGSTSSPVMTDYDRHSSTESDYQATKSVKDVGVQAGGVCYPAEVFQQYYNEISRLQQRCNEMAEEIDRNKRGLSFVADDKKCNYYTGISKFSVLKKLFHFLEPALDQPFCALSKDQLFVMTLTRLRLNSPLTSLAMDYNISVSTASKYVHRTLFVIYESCKWAIQPGDRDTVIKHTPESFIKEFGYRRIFIVDCFEIECETPSDLKASICHFSYYKNYETVKFFIAIHPDGTIAFISQGFAGRTVDKKIFAKSKFVDLIEEGDVVIADKGFEVLDAVENRKATLNIPNFLRKKTQFSLIELDYNRQVTTHRIHVERVIGLIREKYTIVDNRITVNTLARLQNGMPIIDLIVKVSCILVSLNRSIIN